VINPILSVITNIGYDHMNLLGDTLEKIAAEKAGIIKPGIPVVVGEYLDATKPIFIQKANDNNAPIIFAQDEYQVSRLQYALQSLEVDIHHLPNNITETFTLDLNGLYQAKNLCTVLCTEAELIKLGFNIREAAEKFALSHSKKLTGLGGRWELIKDTPAVVLDVAHNENGIREVLQQLEYCNNGKVHFVIGMVNDKDISKVLSLLPTAANYYFTNAHIPRALPYPALVEQAAAMGLKGIGFPDVNEAIAAALKQASPEDLIMVCGSVFVVGEVNRELFS
jgi:dihydrofolate synthase/folylpolyglutamate synthase